MTLPSVVFTINNTTELFTVRFKVTNQDWDTIPITIGRKTAGTELGWDIDVENTDGYVNKRAMPFDTRPADGIYGMVYPVPTLGPITFDLTVPDNGDYIVRVVNYSNVEYLRTRKNILCRLGTIPNGFVFITTRSLSSTSY